VQFGFTGGGSGGVDIVGNGQNYGNYPYTTAQPIILGPLAGDGVTMYEFAVRDHLNPDCHDAAMLGKVLCGPSATYDPGAAGIRLNLSPNPTSNTLIVNALSADGRPMGQADVEVYAADGKFVLAQTVINANNFALDVTSLPAATYRLILKTTIGQMEALFVKN
jgi:hypothetical protein